ncbi:MAG TPA: hypothetical protein EYO59_11265 [Chromatiaceae bacterium]|nr:hypothetical protein [Chromatiaceae bacterium]
MNSDDLKAKKMPIGAMIGISIIVAILATHSIFSAIVFFVILTLVIVYMLYCKANPGKAPHEKLAEELTGNVDAAQGHIEAALETEAGEKAGEKAGEETAPTI